MNIAPTKVLRSSPDPINYILVVVFFSVVLLAGCFIGVYFAATKSSVVDRETADAIITSHLKNPFQVLTDGDVAFMDGFMSLGGYNAHDKRIVLSGSFAAVIEGTKDPLRLAMEVGAYAKYGYPAVENAPHKGAVFSVNTVDEYKALVDPAAYKETLALWSLYAKNPGAWQATKSGNWITFSTIENESLAGIPVTEHRAFAIPVDLMYRFVAWSRSLNP